MFGKAKQIHMVGIGGIGMSGIAEVLLNLHFRVTGSDLTESDITNKLSSLGATVHIGHHPSNLGKADVVVVSSAISPDNPEVRAAKENSIPIIPRAEMLAELMRMKEGIAVAGTHGKTTTTSMISTVLSAGNFDPTSVIGGKINGLGTNAKLGQGRIMVVEADESDGSFLMLSPTVSVVTTIDREHMDHYRDIEHIKDSFLQFINKIPFYGVAVLCLDQPHIQSLIPRVVRRFTTYGISAQADFLAKDPEFDGMESRFIASYKGKALGPIRLRMPGLHNVCNAMAAVAVGLEYDMDFPTVRDALEGFTGVQRRFQIKGEVKDVMVVDDYGHHPQEIESTLRAAKAGWPHRRLVVAFQPHRYTRTKLLMEDFFHAFNDADLLLVTDIYPAGERPLEGADAKLLYMGIKERGHRAVHYVEKKEEIPSYLLPLLRPGDLFVTLGAGDIWKAGEGLLHALSGR